jgi:hypothetical protein
MENAPDRSYTQIKATELVRNQTHLGRGPGVCPKAVATNKATSSLADLRDETKEDTLVSASDRELGRLLSREETVLVLSYSEGQKRGGGTEIS